MNAQPGRPDPTLQGSPGASPRTLPGRVSWNELLAPQPAAAAGFYESLFGWNAVPYQPAVPSEGLPPYTLFQFGPDNADVAGMLPAHEPDAPAQWLPYFVVPDVHAALQTALGLGATALMPVQDLGRVGKIVVIRDPQGATLGLHELAGRAKTQAPG
jgi:predicted enzyme related to lactoylglutathione lyase